MRRRITLYIGGSPVDLSDDSFILFNWAFEDLSNPTTVKNSWSQQITLPGTENNNAVFGHCFRPDRRVTDRAGAVGISFNPLRRTPFTIYSETNEVLQDGYVRLDSVSRRGMWAISWTVTLYGGLGSFFYSLSYDDEGNKLTLADLDYLGTSTPEDELSFNITADTVKEAWLNHPDMGEIDGKWKVVNFAMCYNGIPGSGFSADKALGLPSDFGLADNVSEGTGENTKDYGVQNTNNLALFNLANEVDEYAAKDLRSYLQRPVFAMRALFKAASNPEQNGGFEADLSALTSGSYIYSRLWMTLPMMTSISMQGELGARQVYIQSLPSGKTDLGSYTWNLPFGSTISASVNVCLDLYFPDQNAPQMYLSAYEDDSLWKTSVYFLQLVAFDKSGNVLGGTKVKALYHDFTSNGYLTPQTVAQNVRYAPIYNEGQIFDAAPEECIFQNVEGNSGTYRSEALNFELAGIQGASSLILYVNAYYAYWRNGAMEYFLGDKSNGWLFSSQSGIASEDSANYAQLRDAQTRSIITVDSVTLRSGARVTKRMLLSSGNTPAEYLIAFCKMFGFVFVYDNASRKITVMRREDFYNTGEGVIDITGRVDSSGDITIEPFAFNAKWYDMELEGCGTAFEDSYSAIYGKSYGMQRIDTGYDFDSEAVNLLDGIPFKSAPGVLMHSRYLNYITVDGQYRPSPFVDKGVTYTMWDAEGDSKNFDVSPPPVNADVEYLNSYYPGYDLPYAPKAQLYDSGGSAVEGSGVLLFIRGPVNYPHFKISDDVAEMDRLNGGNACWLLSKDSGSVISWNFSRYAYNMDDWVIYKSLDMGVPSEIDIPGVSYAEDSTVYSKAWRTYLQDRYSVDTKVMKCRVNLSGLPVGQQLLRRFFWYQGAVWVLNSIGNYSMTTWDFAECEFVQVQEIDNYALGQY